ncbi:hypothetical protein AX282_21315 [Bacillus spizizenii]|uniref:hypothetical protein n=1 Tax=Bacillus spizizenii TaxID=96241 RepID=UPI000772CF4A|nr:hypothetical protein [Bacillus spizizenii]KXJ36540.1 hypothetical protein AX282_21315 [Bacillus spizizenii]
MPDINYLLGPNRQMPLDESKTYELNIHPGYRVKLMFGFDAAHENTIILYDEEYNEAVKRDNRNLGNEDWISQKNTGSSPIRLFLTAWNKNPGDNIIRQSPYRELSLSRENSYVQVGFEDATDNDYNDAAVMI